MSIVSGEIMIIIGSILAIELMAVPKVRLKLLQLRFEKLLAIQDAMIFRAQRACCHST